MRRLFSMDGPIMRVLTIAADLMIINLLWLVCSLPIVTIGASSVAGHYACQKLLKSEGSIFRNFFASLKMNFKQATIGWLLIAVAATCLFFDIGILLPLSFPGKIIIELILGILIILFLFIVTIFFPLLAQFQNTLKNTFTNSLRISLMHSKITFILILPIITIVLLLIFATNFFVRIGILWILFGFSLPAYFQEWMLSNIFAGLIEENGESEE